MGNYHARFYEGLGRGDTPSLLSTSNNSSLVYDALQSLVLIVEKSGGVIANNRQFIWDRGMMSEARDSSSSSINQYFVCGQTINTGNYFYCRNRLRSITEMTNSVGNLQVQMSYSAFGEAFNQQVTPPDFQYAGYYLHLRSNLYLTSRRPYNSVVGRWISRDPIEEQGGQNLYAYVFNDPVDFNDASGLLGIHGNWGGPGWGSGRDLGPGGETGPFPHLPGQSGFRAPIDPLDRCYYHHDVCIHNAGIIQNPQQRQCARRQCDKNLAGCLSGLGSAAPGWQIPLFGLPGSPNDNPGADPDPNNPQQPYKIIDPGYGPPQPPRSPH